MIDQATTAQNYALGRELCFAMAMVITAEWKRKHNIQTRVFVREREIQIWYEKIFMLAYNRG